MLMLTVFCTQCYARNQAEDRTCRECGAELGTASGDYVEKLISFSLRHPIPAVAAMAAETLGRIGDARAVKPLMSVVEVCEEPQLLEAAAEALGLLGDPVSVSALRGLVGRGTAAVALRAVAALEKIGGDRAVSALREVADSTVCASVRTAARNALKKLDTGGSKGDETGQPKGRSRPVKAGAAHARGISVTLTIFDEMLCDVEQWANGREISSVFYRERNTLTAEQRQALQARINLMRKTMDTLRRELGLEPAYQDVRSAVRSKMAGLWEHVVELKSGYLRRYGEVPAELAECLDPRVDELVDGISSMLDTLKRGRSDAERSGECDSDAGSRPARTPRKNRDSDGGP